MARSQSKSLREAAKKFLDALAEEQARRVLRRRTVIPQKPKGRPITASNIWQEWETALLGTAPDEEVTRQIGRSTNSVGSKRRRLGIPRSAKYRYWTDEEFA
jgi:hypothetical protein